ncbi:MAG: filament polymerization regulator ParJ [Chloroflexota bacterium]
MDARDFLVINTMPDLRDPVLLAAFAGWSDAAQVATSALLAVCRTADVDRFADIQSEEFFVFTETRPTISLDASGQRSLHWPANRFFALPVPEAERDVVVLIGTEPQLRWKTFCGIVLDLARELRVSRLITLGGLLADVPHTLPPRLQGHTSEPSFLPELRALGVAMTSYQGPTGILGALHDAWREEGKAAFGLWGNVPHYISASPNPQVSLALLQRVNQLLGVDLPVANLENEAQVFRTQIDEAVAQNPEAVEYVRQLEEQFVAETPAEDTPDLLNDLEEFLRRRRPPADE